MKKKFKNWLRKLLFGDGWVECGKCMYRKECETCDLCEGCYLGEEDDD